MNIESNYDMNEKEVLINILNKYPLMDTLNIYKIIENMIYEEVEEYHSNGGSLKSKYTLRFGKKEGLYQEWYQGENNTISDRGQKRDRMYL